MSPVIFLSYPSDISGNYGFKLMNFGLNISDEIEKAFIKHKQYFGDILDCNYPYKSIMIFGRAKFNFTGIKGADLQFGDVDKVLNGERLYYEWPYIVEKGDYNFECGGYSPFSPHFILINLIANKDAKATLTFSSNEYILMDTADSEFEEAVSKRQTPYHYKEFSENNQILNKCTNTVGKMFDLDYRNKYFKTSFENGFNTSKAVDVSSEQ